MESGAEKNRRRVVVIGGGIAGSLIAKSLQFHSDLTLLDKKEYLEIPYASSRAMVDPSFGERSVIEHREYLMNARIVVSTAIDITEIHVLTAEGRLIAYDYLVIATGHADSAPESRFGRLNQFHHDYEKISSARSILIAGGGPNGVELAGEFAVDFPDKKLTLVHNGPRLLEFMGPKAADKALRWLRSKRVDVRLDRSVDLDGPFDVPKTYRISNGEEVDADLAFPCTGKPLGSAWLNGTELKSSLDAHGRVMVDGNLRVKGRDNVFAIGDITDINEAKQGYSAQKHALVAARNLRLLMAGEKESKLEIYEPHSLKAFVSLGRRDAVAQLSFTTVIGSVPGMVKSRDLFVGKTRKKLGLESHATP